MGATCDSWRTYAAVIITLLQIQALVSVKTTAVVGVEGQRFDFRCKYEDGQQNNTKSFHDHGDGKVLIQTQKHDQWHKSRRFSLYDNTTGAFFIVRVDRLTPTDSGKYRCGVDHNLHLDSVQLNVSRANLLGSLTHPITESSVFPRTDPVNKFHLWLLVTAVMCVGAMLFICLFTLCLLLAVRCGRPARQPNRETSSDYETMMPGVTTEPELRCSSSVPDCDDLLALPPPPPPPDGCPRFTSKHRESALSTGLGEYVYADVPKDIDPYQQLDLSQLEAHVYDSIAGPLAVRKQISSCNS